MAYIYEGNGGSNTVSQTGFYDYDEIYTYGGSDKITLRLFDTYVDAGSGNDKVTSYVEGGNDVVLGYGNDTYTGYGRSNDSTDYDVVTAGSGNDTMNVWTSWSDYYGQAGNDTFNSVGDSNLLNGGSGIDTVSYKLQDSDDDIDGLSGYGIDVDLADGSASSGGSREEDLISIENVEGTSYADDIFGSSGSNKLLGGSGADIVDGRGGADLLYGNAGDDDLYGGTGNDKMVGGTGNDIMEGESGADGFFFYYKSESLVGSKRDVITDFSHSEGDYINLTGMDAIAGGGNDDFDFIGSAGFSDTAGELRFKNGILSGDTNGDGLADFEIKLTDVTKLYLADLDL